MAWLPGQRPEAVRGVVPGDEVWAPPVWWYELANALATLRRNGRLSEADCGRAFATFESLGIRLDAAPDAGLALRIHDLAVEHGLSAYDAAYLELAIRQKATLLTLDARLAKAAARAGVAVAP